MTLPSRFLGLCSILLSLAASAAPSRPNLVFILADDLGWADLGCQGSRYYETPHIHRLTVDKSVKQRTGLSNRASLGTMRCLQARKTRTDTLFE